MYLQTKDVLPCIDHAKRRGSIKAGFQKYHPVVVVVVDSCAVLKILNFAFLLKRGAKRKSLKIFVVIRGSCGSCGFQCLCDMNPHPFNPPFEHSNIIEAFEDKILTENQVVVELPSQQEKCMRIVLF